MMLRHYGFLGALSVAIAAVVACGSSDSSTSSTTQAVTTNFDGVYVPKTAGGIGSISFTHGTDYLLMPTGCSSEGCSEIGTYRIDGAKGVVDLTSASGSTRSLSLKVISTERRQTTIAKTQSVGGFTLSVRDLIEKDAGGSNLVGGGDGGSLVALIQALVNAITQAALGGQDMSQVGGSDAGSDDGSDNNSDDTAEDAGTSTCPDGGADAGRCAWASCMTNVPTSASTIAQINVYWARCPGGPLTYYDVH